VLWKGPPGSETWSKDANKLELFLSPPVTSVMDAYPMTRLFAHDGDLFLLQVSAQHRSFLDFDHVVACGDRIQRTRIAQLTWPVTRQMDRFCHKQADEEAALAVASPALLYQSAFKTRFILLNVRNRVLAYDVSKRIHKLHLNKCKTTTFHFHNSTAMSPVANLTTIVALPLHEASSSMAIEGTTMATLSSFGIMTTVDLSIGVPCGQVMKEFGSEFKSLSLSANEAEARHKTNTTVTLAIAKRARQGAHTATFICELSMKTKLSVKGRRLKKYVACCNPIGTAQARCCVKKDVALKVSLTKIRKGWWQSWSACDPRTLLRAA